MRQGYPSARVSAADPGDREMNSARAKNLFDVPVTIDLGERSESLETWLETIDARKIEDVDWHAGHTL